VYPFEVDLARAHVFFDWDGTVSRRDTGVYLLERLAIKEWRDSEDRYGAGLIGSRETLIEQWAALPHDETLLRATAQEVETDPAFGAVVEALREAGARVTVVSDGFGFHVEQACAPFGVDVITNAVDWATGTLTFPNTDRCCPCSTCGTCKQAPIRDARTAGLTTVFVGDGTSDRKAALLADVLFAKDGLARWCDQNDVAFTSFRTIQDVADELFD
jgi:2-hydroxy-3-keto-5-methylthiopentenyl-1-phosphate phosphatase